MSAIPRRVTRSRTRRSGLKSAITPVTFRPFRTGKANVPWRPAWVASEARGDASPVTSSIDPGRPVAHTRPRSPAPRLNVSSRLPASKAARSLSGRCQECSRRNTFASLSTLQNSPVTQAWVSQMPCSTWGAASDQLAALASGRVTANCTLRRRSAVRRWVMSVTKATKATRGPEREVAETEISIGNSRPSRWRPLSSRVRPMSLPSPVSMKRVSPRRCASR